MGITLFWCALLVVVGLCWGLVALLVLVVVGLVLVLVLGGVMTGPAAVAAVAAMLTEVLVVV